ncbi:MAG: photosynthetic complex putative assembly protein PuhB [Pseudomonadota bacterium]
MSHDDFETEPVPGLPAHLPEGEEMVWQGAPDARAFARSVLHERKIMGYFAVLAIWKFSTAIYDGGTALQGLIAAAFMILSAALVWLIIRWYAGAVARTTVYTITNKRVVMRFGVALPVTFNYPFAQITTADVKALIDDAGTLTLGLKEHTKVSWAILWPHARPWRVAKPEPAMRAVADIETVAGILSTQLHEFHHQPIPRNSSLKNPKPAKKSEPIGGGLMTVQKV